MDMTLETPEPPYRIRKPSFTLTQFFIVHFSIYKILIKVVRIIDFCVLMHIEVAHACPKFFFLKKLYEGIRNELRNLHVFSQKILTPISAFTSLFFRINQKPLVFVYISPWIWHSTHLNFFIKKLYKDLHIELRNLHLHSHNFLTFISLFTRFF